MLSHNNNSNTNSNNTNSNTNISIYIAPWLQVTLFKSAVKSSLKCIVKQVMWTAVIAVLSKSAVGLGCFENSQCRRTRKGAVTTPSVGGPGKGR